jgi:hypothetical protein
MKLSAFNFYWKKPAILREFSIPIINEHSENFIPIPELQTQKGVAPIDLLWDGTNHPNFMKIQHNGSCEILGEPHLSSS